KSHPAQLIFHINLLSTNGSVNQQSSTNHRQIECKLSGYKNGFQALLAVGQPAELELPPLHFFASANTTLLLSHLAWPSAKPTLTPSKWRPFMQSSVRTP